MVYKMFSGALGGQATALNGHGAQITRIGTMKTEERQYGETFNNKKMPITPIHLETRSQA